MIWNSQKISQTKTNNKLEPIVPHTVPCTAVVRNICKMTVPQGNQVLHISLFCREYWKRLGSLKT